MKFMQSDHQKHVYLAPNNVTGHPFIKMISIYKIILLTKKSEYAIESHFPSYCLISYIARGKH